MAGYIDGFGRYYLSMPSWSVHLQDFVQSAHLRAAEASEKGSLSTRAQVMLPCLPQVPFTHCSATFTMFSGRTPSPSTDCVYHLIIWLK